MSAFVFLVLAAVAAIYGVRNGVEFAERSNHYLPNWTVGFGAAFAVSAVVLFFAWPGLISAFIVLVAIYTWAGLIARINCWTTYWQVPAYKHDCDDCVFLGRYYKLNGDFDAQLVDLYFHRPRTSDHPYASAMTTLVARYSDEGSDYVSGSGYLINLYRELGQAYIRACERGLFHRPDGFFVVSLDVSGSMSSEMPEGDWDIEDRIAAVQAELLDDLDQIGARAHSITRKSLLVGGDPWTGKTRPPYPTLGAHVGCDCCRPRE